jgi:hypothetical protein
MRRRNAAIVLAILAVVAFFIFVPAVPISLCNNEGNGFASLSYRLLYTGEIYLGGHFSYENVALAVTFNAQNCRQDSIAGSNPVKPP